MTPAEITRLERASSAIFLGDATWERHGWRALVSALPNRRANAAYPFAAVEDLEGAIRDVRAFFEAHGKSPLFKLSPGTPGSVRAGLRQAGWVGRYGADVMTMSLAGPIEGPSTDVGIADHLTRSWLDTYCAARSLDPVTFRRGYQAPGSQIGAASLDGAAFGMGIIRDGWLGVFNMLTIPERRSQGYASRILDALVAWGAQRGATSAYLQVVADNVAAQGLYTGRGFQVSYAYEYWEEPVVGEG